MMIASALRTVAKDLGITLIHGRDPEQAFRECPFDPDVAIDIETRSISHAKSMDVKGGPTLGTMLHEIAHIVCGPWSIIRDEEGLEVVEAIILRELCDRVTSMSEDCVVGRYLRHNEFMVLTTHGEILADLTPSQYREYIDSELTETRTGHRYATEVGLAKRLDMIPDDKMRAKIAALCTGGK